jgi:hypothetical protein
LVAASQVVGCSECPAASAKASQAEAVGPDRLAAVLELDYPAVLE